MHWSSLTLDELYRERLKQALRLIEETKARIKATERRMECTNQCIEDSKRPITTKLLRS